MLILAVLLVLLAVALGFFAQANNGTHDFTLFGSHWTTYDWVPVALAAGAGVALLAIATAYYALRMGRLRRAHATLQREADLLKLERATAAVAMKERAAAEKSARPGARELVGRPVQSDVPIAPNAPTAPRHAR